MNKRESMDFLQEISVNCIEVLHFIESICQSNNQLLKNRDTMKKLKQAVDHYQVKAYDYNDKWQTLEKRCRILIEYIRGYSRAVCLDDELVHNCEKILAGKAVIKEE